MFYKTFHTHEDGLVNYFKKKKKKSLPLKKGVKDKALARCTSVCGSRLT